MTTSPTSRPCEMPSLAALTAPSYPGRAFSLPVNMAPSGRRPSALAAMVMRKKSEIDIVLDGEEELVHSYSTYDEIKGHVDVKFDKDTLFDDMIITFEGQSATFVEKIASTAPTTGRTTGKHTFLRMQQPVHFDVLPEDGMFRAGVTYSLPFTFVVPDRLLPYICTHKVDNEEIRKEHCQLPPSLGDPTISGDGHTAMDDLAPDMSKIVYAIRARAIKRGATSRLIELADRVERIRIVPGKQEEPPLSIDENKSDYILRKEKTVKKGLFKIGKIGRLTAETSQPRSLHLPHPRHSRSRESISTMTTVNLRFDPHTPEDLPPQLDSIVSKLRVYTFFGAAPFRYLPSVYRCDAWSTLHGVYPESVPLSSRCLSTVSWTRHEPSSEEPGSSSTDLSRHLSSYSTSSASSIPEPSCSYQAGSPFYTASVLVPISLPSPQSTSRPKVFVPSFNSCIISRTYSLELNLSYHTPGTNVSNPRIILKSPIQISSEGGTPPAPAPESDEAIVAEIERQFGLYEARQLQDELGLESPIYEETAAPATTMSMPTTRHASVDSGAPPEYNAGSVLGRPRGPRTQSVSISA